MVNELCGGPMPHALGALRTNDDDDDDNELGILYPCSCHLRMLPARLSFSY